MTAAGAAAQAAYYRDAMTFSIVARSDDGDSLGVAVASKFLAVGSAVPAARLGVGAVATQSFCNTLYKRDGLQRMADGASAGETLDALLAADDEREERQAGIVDAAGLAATWTGSGCMDWAGGFTGPGFAIQGNILTGPDVLDAMRDAFVDSQGQALAERLLAASTGSYTPGDDLAYDLRVDDHPEPVSELERLLGLHHLFFDRPTTDDLLPLEGELADEVSSHLARLGYPDLETWAGVENYELRVVPGQIDSTVLARLREQAGSGS